MSFNEYPTVFINPLDILPIISIILYVFLLINKSITVPNTSIIKCIKNEINGPVKLVIIPANECNLSFILSLNFDIKYIYIFDKTILKICLINGGCRHL